MNPLKTLCDRMGVTVDAMAKRLDVKADLVERALRDEPQEPLSTYLKLYQDLKIETRVKVVRPLGFWFDRGAIDALVRDNLWRRASGHDDAPLNKDELRKMIRSMRKQGLSYQNIADRFYKDWVPTSRGLRHWRQSTIAQHLKGGKIKGAEEIQLEPSESFLRQFRRHISECLIAESCPFDPAAMMRYKIEGKWGAGRLWIFNETPVPEAIHSWSSQAIGDLKWFKQDQWGHGLPTDVVFDEESSGEEEETD